MSDRMTWREIQRVYPDQWVAIGQVSRRESGPDGDLEGEVVVHEPDKEKFYEQLKSVAPGIGAIDLRHTGPLIPATDTPLLWQILHTS